MNELPPRSRGARSHAGPAAWGLMPRAVGGSGHRQVVDGAHVVTHDSLGDRLRQLVLPGPEYPPARGGQGGVDRAVPGGVAGELRLPIGGVCAREVAVLGAAMPEAAVYEHREPRPGKDDVGSNEAAGDTNGQVDSESQPAPVQLAAKRELGAAVATPVASHSLADLGGGRLGVGKGNHLSSQAGPGLLLGVQAPSFSRRWSARGVPGPAHRAPFPPPDGRHGDPRAP
jgi:hypothetical protein